MIVARLQTRQRQRKKSIQMKECSDLYEIKKGLWVHVESRTQTAAGRDKESVKVGGARSERSVVRRKRRKCVRAGPGIIYEAKAVNTGPRRGANEI